MKSKKILIFVSVLATVGIGYYIALAANWGFTGFSWIGNNLQNGLEQGDPVVGMIGMKGANYQVTISGEGDQRPLVGSAWMGIGSIDDKFNDFTNQNDYPSIGWIHFNQAFDQAKLGSLISTNCYGAGDCHGIRWNKKPGSSSGFEGYLSGWARMELGPNGDTTPYPDTWVHFKSPGDPNNYTCNEGDKNYYVCVDGSGRLEGFAWSAGAEHAAIDSNPGLGWIKFSKKFAGLEDLGGGVVASSKIFCATLLEEGSDNTKCLNSDNSTSDFTFRAYQSGFILNSFDPNKNFQWICNPSKEPRQLKVGETVTCQYNEEGTYTPELKIFDEASQRWESCDSHASVKVTSEESCTVGVRKANTGSNTKFEESITIGPDNTIEAEVDRQCLSGGENKWSVTGGSFLFENGDSAGFKAAGGTTKISASIVKDGKTFRCGTATVEVREEVQWR